MQNLLAEFRSQLRRRKWLVRGVAVFVLYLLVGFFLVPVLLKWQLLKQLPPATHRQVTVREVKCNPLALSLTVRGLAVAEINGAPFVSFEEFYSNFQLSTLFRWAWTFDEISLKEPRAEIVLGPDGRFSFADLLEPSTNAPPAKPKPEAGLPRLLVFNLSLTNGHVGFADLSRKTPFRTAYAPINIILTRFSTKPNRQSPYSFEASSDSGRGIAWAGTVTAQPLGSTGTVEITGVRLPKHAPYLEDFTRAELTDGTLDVRCDYAFATGNNGTALVASNLAVTVTKLQLKDPDTSEVVAALSALELREGRFDLRARHLGIGSLVVTDPTSLVRRRADGSINLLSLVAGPTTTNAAQVSTTPPPAGTPTERPWIVALDDFQIQGGSVQFEDATVPSPFRSLLKPVTVRLQHFSTAANADATFQAEVASEVGEVVNLAGSYSVNPVRGASALKVTGVELQKYQPYLAPFFRGVLAGGKVDVSLESSQEWSGEALQALVTNAMLRISDLSIHSPDGETLVSIPAFAIENAAGSLAEKAVRIAGIRSEGTMIRAQRDADGTINLLSLIATPTNSAARPKTESAASGDSWSVALEELALRDWTLHLIDHQTTKPATLELDELALTLRGAQFPGNSTVAAECSARVNGAGTIATRGTIQPYSPSAVVEIGVAGLELRGFQPWVEQQLKLGIESGVLNTTGRVEFAAAESDSPKLHFAGALGVQNLATIDQRLFKELVRWDELAIEGIDFDLAPKKATVERVRFSGLTTSVIIDPSARLNLLSVFPSADTNAPAVAPDSAANMQPETETEAGETFAVQLDELKLEKTAIHFSDQSVQPPCAFNLEQLDGTVTGLSTEPNSNAAVEITGRVDEASPFGLRGKFNPLARDLALALVFTNANLQLTPFTPYLERYAGYPLNKGRLSLDLSYTVEAKALKAQNKVRIDQLMLGQRNGSPEATKLPVKLAVALLKDNNGRIDLDLPVEGRFDDPQFRVGPIILQVVGNVITKAAAAPFKLLGALVGGGEEMSFVAFEAGEAQLLGAETNKLDKLVQALEKRPALNLEIEGSIDPGADRDVLARRTVKQELKSQRLQELSAIGRAPPSAADFQLDPMDYERLLRAAVAKTWGTNLTAALRTAAERAAATTNASAAVQRSTRGPGFFKRAASLFKPREERVAIKQAYRAAKADAQLRESNPELAQLRPDEMETLLAAKQAVSADDLQQLMQDRAKAVQAYLVSGGKVAAERLFLIAPKPPGADFKGEARVHLSLN